MSDLQKRVGWMETFRLVSQKRKAGQLSKYLSEAMTVRNFDEVASRGHHDAARTLTLTIL